MRRRGPLQAVLTSRLATDLTDDTGLEPVAAVLDEHGRLVDRPVLTPGPQRGQHVPQLPACLGQVIFEPAGLVFLTLQDPGTDERLQPGGQSVAGRAGVPGDLTEPVIAQVDLTHREQRPAVAHQLERRGVSIQQMAFTHVDPELLGGAHAVIEHGVVDVDTADFVGVVLVAVPVVLDPQDRDACLVGEPVA